MIRSLVCAGTIMCLLFAVSLHAQQTSSQPPQSQQSVSPSSSSSSQEVTTPDSAKERHAEAERELKQEEQQRMLGVVPAFTAVFNGHAVPLSPGQKFRLWLTDAIDPFDFAAAGVDAALEQHSNEYPEYGPGFSGYAKRYGASYADDFDGTLWGEALLPILLHQDARYFRLGHGSFEHRLGYSLLSAVRCKGDNGRWQPNVSNIGGNLIGGAVANVYYPSVDRGAALTFERGFTVTGEGLLGSLANEFYPDVASRLFHHKKKGSPTP